MEKLKNTDFSLWEAFFWVAKRNSFTAAAAQLRVGVPLLSKKIGLLESSLGTRLFFRTTRRVSLTQEGAALLPRVEALLEEVSDLESTAQPSLKPRGLIRVSTLPALALRYLPARLVAFQKQFPEVTFEVLVAEHLIDVVESQVDVAIRVQKPTGADFVFRKLAENELVLCASPAYLKACGQPLTRVSDLEKHDLLFLSVYDPIRFKNSKVSLSDFRHKRKILCENGAVLSEMLLQGAGIGVRSRWDVAPFLKTGQMVQVLESAKLDSFQSVYAMTPHRKFQTEKVRTFIEFLTRESL